VHREPRVCFGRIHGRQPVKRESECRATHTYTLTTALTPPLPQRRGLPYACTCTCANNGTRGPYLNGTVVLLNMGIAIPYAMYLSSARLAVRTRCWCCCCPELVDDESWWREGNTTRAMVSVWCGAHRPCWLPRVAWSCLQNVLHHGSDNGRMVHLPPAITTPPHSPAPSR
jgi:hypothetical protein